MEKIVLHSNDWYVLVIRPVQKELNKRVVDYARLKLSKWLYGFERLGYTPSASLQLFVIG